MRGCSAGVRDVKKLRANEAMGEMGKASAALDDEIVELRARLLDALHLKRDDADDAVLRRAAAEGEPRRTPPARKPWRPGGSPSARPGAAGAALAGGTGGAAGAARRGERAEGAAISAARSWSADDLASLVQLSGSGTPGSGEHGSGEPGSGALGSGLGGRARSPRRARR